MLSQERTRQIEALIADAQGNRRHLVGKQLELLDAARDLMAEHHRRTPQPGRRIPCPDHPDQPASRCRTCTAEAAHDGTSLTVDTVLYLLAVDRAFSLLKGISLFKNCHLAVRFLFH